MCFSSLFALLSQMKVYDQIHHIPLSLLKKGGKMEFFKKALCFYYGMYSFFLPAYFQ